jgi:hypothetical protein
VQHDAHDALLLLRADDAHEPAVRGRVPGLRRATPHRDAQARRALFDREAEADLARRAEIFPVTSTLVPAGTVRRETEIVIRGRTATSTIFDTT